MATQGQRRKEAVSAVRQMKGIYRKADSLGERAERELNRLSQRKTLIGPDDLAKLADQINGYVRAVETVQKAFVVLADIIRNLPR